MQQSVYEGLLAQGGSAPLPGELGVTRVGGFQANQAIVSLLGLGAGWYIYNMDNKYSMIGGAIALFVGLGGLIDSAY